MPLTDEHKKDVFVFDEDFLRDNVKAYLKPEVVAEIETWKGEEDGWISFGSGFKVLRLAKRQSRAHD